MYVQIMAGLFITALVMCGFYCGVFVERVRWNQLIQKGVLPKPNKR